MKEEEIRPQKVFDEYLRLTREDTLSFFSNVTRENGGCPACNANGEKSFTKHGFDYEVCLECQTLFVNPRPIAETFTRYYTESASSEFWATTFYKETAAARSEKLWKPKAKMVQAILASNNASEYSIVDIGGGYGLFAEEMRRISNQN